MNTPAPGTVSVMDSGRGTRLMVSVDELLPVFVSPVTETVAVSAIEPDAVLPTKTTRGIVLADAPGAIAPELVHVTAWPEALQFQPTALPDLYVSCDGRVSVTVIVPLVEPLPTFATASVKMPPSPAPKLPVLPVVIERSGPNVTVSVDELLAESVSPAVATVAVLEIEPVVEAPTETTSGIAAALAPAEIGPGFVQVTTCPEALQPQPVAMPETNVN